MGGLAQLLREASGLPAPPRTLSRALAKSADPADVIAAADAAAERAHHRATFDVLTAIVPVAGVDPWLMAVLIGQLMAQADPDDIDEMRAWPLGRWAVAVRAHLDDLATAEPEPASPLAIVPTPKLPIDVETGPVPIAAVPPLALPAPEPRGDRDRLPPAEPPPSPRPKLYLVPAEPEAGGGGAGGFGGGGGPPIPAPPPGLPDEIREAWIQARTRAGEYCRGLGNVIRRETGELVREAWDGEDIVTEVDREQRLRTVGLIREQTAEALAQGWTPERLASELANRGLDWSRDWLRIARTELQAAMNDGAFVEGIRTFGHEARFARVPNGDACKTCRRLFLDEDGRPRIFTAQELLLNGTNVGRKAAELKATLFPPHPNCACGVLAIPPGLTLNRDWDMVREEP